MTTLYQAHDPNAAFRSRQRAKVTVGGKSIPSAAISREMQNHEAATPLEAWQAAARALVVREMLLQEARRLGIEAQPIDGRRGAPRDRRGSADPRRYRGRGLAPRARRGNMPPLLPA